MFSQQIRDKVWLELSNGQKLPKKLLRHLDKLKELLWEDHEFWLDLLIRHNLLATNLDELDDDMREHALWNFQAMLFQTAHENGYKV